QASLMRLLHSVGCAELQTKPQSAYVAPDGVVIYRLVGAVRVVPVDDPFEFVDAPEWQSDNRIRARALQGCRAEHCRATGFGDGPAKQIAIEAGRPAPGA